MLARVKLHFLPVLLLVEVGGWAGGDQQCSTPTRGAGCYAWHTLCQATKCAAVDSLTPFSLWGGCYTVYDSQPPYHPLMVLLCRCFYLFFVFLILFKKFFAFTSFNGSALCLWTSFSFLIKKKKLFYFKKVKKDVISYVLQCQRSCLQCTIQCYYPSCSS